MYIKHGFSLRYNQKVSATPIFWSHFTYQVWARLNCLQTPPLPLLWVEGLITHAHPKSQKVHETSLFFHRFCTF